MRYITTAERIGIEKGMRIGILKKAKEIAENLLEMGVLTNGQIAWATGLSLKEIRNLKKRLGIATHRALICYGSTMQQLDIIVP